MFLIGELSRRTGIAPSALRYYEDLGLVPKAVRQGKRRVYTEQAVDRIAFIQLAQSCGFRLDEIAGLLDDTGANLSTRWRTLAVSKLAELDGIIENAKRMKRHLARAIECNCAGAEACGRMARKQRPGT